MPPVVGGSAYTGGCTPPLEGCPLAWGGCPPHRGGGCTPPEGGVARKLNHFSQKKLLKNRSIWEKHLDLIFFWETKPTPRWRFFLASPKKPSNGWLFGSTAKLFASPAFVATKHRKLVMPTTQHSRSICQQKETIPRLLGHSTGLPAGLAPCFLTARRWPFLQVFLQKVTPG